MVTPFREWPTSPSEGSFGHSEEHVRRDPRESGEVVVRRQVPSLDGPATMHRQDREQRPSVDRDGTRDEGRSMRKKTTMHVHERVLQGQDGRQEHASEEGRHQQP